MSIAIIQPRIAVIGAGIAGAACAAGLHRAGLDVTVFDKSRGVGGRMATRRVEWIDPGGSVFELEFDHGAQHFGARHPRFKLEMARAERAGVLARWQPHIHTAWPELPSQTSLVAVPNMPALARHLLDRLPLRSEHPVHHLERDALGWTLVMGDRRREGPFSSVMLAIPPAQAALLLAGHEDTWANTLQLVRMEACWTLMAATEDFDWPWDAAQPERGPIAWVARNERKPGRSAPPGVATWVAHATPAFSKAHLHESPEAIAAELGRALQALWPANRPLQWHHLSAHRWRYARPYPGVRSAEACWWDGTLGLGLCGDFLVGEDVEAAWRSGDELADTVAAALEESPLCS
jgi:predicted NAD/FAD-dependent oxidoreductase